jgi:outer membrane protein TolC
MKVTNSFCLAFFVVVLISNSLFGQNIPVKARIMELTVQAAVMESLDNNISFSITKLNPKVEEALVQVERGRFEEYLSASTFWESQSDRDENQNRNSVDISKFDPSGTSIRFDLAQSKVTGYENRLSASVTLSRALLNGNGSQVNLAELRSAQLGVDISNYELAEAAQTLVAEVEINYWNLKLAREALRIYSESFILAQDQLDRVQDKVRTGKLDSRELAAAKAELSSRREDLITARNSVEKNRLTLLRFLNLSGEEFWSMDIELKDEIDLSGSILDDVNVHVALALRDRPVLNQARLELEQRTLQVVVTRNGVLPRLDAFVGLASYSRSESFYSRDSVTSDFQVGLRFAKGLGQRSPKGRAKEASLLEQQQKEALQNLLQLTQQDLRIAYVNVETALEQVEAASATRKFREESSSAEMEKFRDGKSTSILVAQAARDLVISRVAEVKAQVEVKKALVELYLIEGSILSRKGISL